MVAKAVSSCESGTHGLLLHIGVLLMKHCRPRSADKAKVIQVIVTQSVVGSGVNGEDLPRAVTSYWSLDGDLLAEYDPLLERIDPYQQAMRPSFCYPRELLEDI